MWYLPLAIVRNPKKPEKIRLIWDAAVRVNGVSFNDILLEGPYMLTSLFAVKVPHSFFGNTNSKLHVGKQLHVFVDVSA